MVTVNNVSVLTQQSIPLLNNVSCVLPKGRITSFIGKSGAGKTTLLKSIVGLVPTYDGTIIINNQELSTFNVTQRAKTIGYVFQDFNLFPHYTVLQNCIDPLLVLGMNKVKAEQEAYFLLKQLGIDAYAHVYPSALSGGQKQRVAIARALGLQPSILLLDEPTASLDPGNTDILVNILKNLAQQGLTIALSSQDIRFITSIFDNVYYLDAGIIREQCDGLAMIDQSPLIKQFVS